MSSTDETLASVGQQIRELSKEVESSSAVEQPKWAKFDNEIQRFELWARNLGLYTGGHSSLDYRFRDAQLLFDHTLSLLRDLVSVLSQREETLMRARGDWQLIGVLLVLRIITRDASQDEKDISEDSEEEDITSYRDKPLFEVLTESTCATIDKLYRLAFKIRNPAMRLGSSRALGYHEVDPETGVELMKQFAQLDEKYIQDLFRSYNPLHADDHYLIPRLAKANTLRRQQFRYWKKRREAFERLSTTDLVDEDADKRQGQISEERENLLVSGMGPIVVAPSQPSTATYLNVDKVKLDDNMSVISTVSFLYANDEEDGDSLNLPAPPNLGHEVKEFECPYCFTICPPKLLKKKLWEAHILRDLRPYICTYEHCKAFNQPYDSFDDWVNHEALNHRMNDQNEGKHQTAPSEHDASRNCPFCLVPAASPFHVATHLHRVASFALPRSNSDAHMDDGSRPSNQAELRSRESQLSWATFSNERGEQFGSDISSSIPGRISSFTQEDLEQHVAGNDTELSNVYSFLGDLDERSQPLEQQPLDQTFNDLSIPDVSAFSLDFTALENPDNLENFDFDAFFNADAEDVAVEPEARPVNRATSLSISAGNIDPDNLPLSSILDPDGGIRPSMSPTSSPSFTAPQRENIPDTFRRNVQFNDGTYDATDDALALHNALSQGRNIDTTILIKVLPHLTSDKIMELRKEYKKHAKLHGRGINLAKHIRLKLGNSPFGKVCYATALGRWESEAFWANFYHQPDLSRRELLIECLFGRSNSEIHEIKESFKDSRYDDSLEKCIKAELKADKFRMAILIVLEESRQSERDSVDTDLVARDVQALHSALASPHGGETAMIDIVVRRSDSHLREVLRAYEKIYQRNFAREMIQKSQNLIGELLAHILNGVINRPMRDALLLDQALRSGKKCAELLISRLVRLHWEPRHLENVKNDFHCRYGERLEEVIAEEILSTSRGTEWGEFCINLAQSSETLLAGTD